MLPSLDLGPRFFDDGDDPAYQDGCQADCEGGALRLALLLTAPLLLRRRR